MTTGNARTLPVWDRLPGFEHRLSGDMPAGEAPDVLVIGAGIAGMTTALRLAQEGREVVVIDREGPGAGETLRTTAHLASALDDRFYHLARWHGADGARQAAASHAAAIDWIERFAAGSGGCGFRRVPGYLFPHDGDERRIRRELDAARDAGLEVEFLDDGVPGVPAMRPALRFAAQARIDIDAYLRALVAAAQDAGVRCFRAEALKVEGGERPVAHLADGVALHAAAIVIASNVPFHEAVAIHTKQAAYRSYVVAAGLPAGAAPDALLWDDGDPYHYVRLVEARDGGDALLLVGGADHKTGQDEDPTAYVRLQEWTRRMFPAVTGFSHGWSGQIIEPNDGLAFIGRDPGGEANVYIATGDSGNGITHGTLAGLLLTDLIVGRDNPWAQLYDPKRKMFRGAGEWLRENANVAAQYADWVGAGDIHALDELGLGEGAVIRHGMHRVAVYRDGDGRLCSHSARCTHLGCAVRWSAAEKSWNCPCHGSRFDGQTGAVLNGPASRPLEPFDPARLDPDRQ
ncbi:FAD-dependent oxidoreductase [Luteimonas salinisoli]|nr:FAD-dependent oxidoreductase [Luteimonas salinisoli]